MTCIQKIFLFLLILFPVVGNSFAQERGFSWGALGSSGNMGREFSSVNLESYAGYNFTPNFSAYLKAETDVILLKKEEVEKHYPSQALGVLLKYNVYKFSSGIFDLRAGTGTNLRSDDWRYLYWDMGFFLQATREITKPTIGLVFRYYNTLEKGEKNYPSVYVSVGFTVN
ncbi:hypothetical protein QYZ87_00885 [Porphyromonadaceae bacterium W3.11]|nr:hypothetical protein [Porphyromonadaceae bacterium W3.11]